MDGETSKKVAIMTKSMQSKVVLGPVPFHKQLYVQDLHMISTVVIGHYQSPNTQKFDTIFVAKNVAGFAEFHYIYCGGRDSHYDRSYFHDQVAKFSCTSYSVEWCGYWIWQSCMLFFLFCDYPVAYGKCVLIGTVNHCETSSYRSFIVFVKHELFHNFIWWFLRQRTQ